MEETSLRITGANKTFLNKITTTFSKIILPTKININSMFINIKRNAMLKAFEHYISATNEKEIYEKKYDVSYEAYLATLDKYVMDSVYKKVKNNTATDFEKDALAKYYSVISLKENEYVEYKFRKQQFLLELDYKTSQNTLKDKTLQKLNNLYVQKMDWLYKGILKNYSIKLADSSLKFDTNKEWVYIKIFNTLNEYLEKILSLKLSLEKGNEKYNEIRKEFEEYEAYQVGKLDQRDLIEKNMLLLGISRKLFIHSLPLTVAEQCYMKLLKDARCLVQDTKIATKRERAYNMLITLMEDYYTKLLSTKVYFESDSKREQFKKFWNKYQEINKLKDTNFIEYVKQKEVLFIKDDLQRITGETFDYSKLTKYYKRKLVDYGEIKVIKGYTSSKCYIKKKK